MEIVEQISQLTYTQRQVFDVICWFARRMKNVVPSQEYIANKVGIKRETVNRTIALLKKIGLLTTTSRLWRSSVYHVNPLIWVDKIRWKFAKYFPSIGFFSVVTLCINTVLLGTNSRYKYPLEKGGSMATRSKIMDIKNINLTRWGRIKLMAFPDEAIEYVDKALGYTRSIRDPFRWFVGMCIDYCKRESLPIDSDITNMLSAKYGIKEDEGYSAAADPRDWDGLGETEKPFKKQTAAKKPSSSLGHITGATASVQEVTDSVKFRKWTGQYITAGGEWAHSLQHMIMNLETISDARKAPYICNCGIV